jgi:hypothetical protein
MMTAAPATHSDAGWWYLTIGLATLGAAGMHRVGADVRRVVPPAVRRWYRRRRRPTALAGGRHSG